VSGLPDRISMCWQNRGYHAMGAGPCFDTVEQAVAYRDRELERIGRESDRKADTWCYWVARRPTGCGRFSFNPIAYGGPMSGALKESGDIKIVEGMTYGAIQSQPFRMKDADASVLREVIKSAERHAAVLAKAHGHFDELLTGCQAWVFYHAVAFGLTLDGAAAAHTVESAAALLALGGQDVPAITTTQGDQP
jgi:hypothetical protein